MIEKQELLKIAKLSKLEIQEKKLDKLQNELSQMLDSISKLQELDTENIPEMFNSVDIRNIEREDVAFKYKEANLIEKEKDGYLVVKKILEDE